MTSERRNVSSGSIFESQVGFSRAVRVGGWVHVSGTTGTDAHGRPPGPGCYEQAVAALDKIERALGEAGASITDVVRTRTFITDIADFDEFARAHTERFGAVRPAATLVEVSALVGEGLVIEIEVDAYVGVRES
jgi:enamine deaminase RidA (YjgF/YER057c/UK114 family)